MNHSDSPSPPPVPPESNGDPVIESSRDRKSEPLGTQAEAPRLPFTVVGVGASAGGLEAYTDFLKACEPTGNIAYVMIQHLSPKHTSVLTELLSRQTVLTVLEVADGLEVKPDHVYVIRPGVTMTIAGGHLHLGESAAEPMNRRPIDDFFKSLAEEQRERAVAVILSGTGSNGTLGCESIKTVGGFVLAEDPQSAKFPSMPRSVIDANLADAILKPGEMFSAIRAYAGHPYASGDEQMPEMVALRERRAMGEILAVLRARTRHDFTVYKKPTLVRRIQRRMSLLQLDTMDEYAKAIREAPPEVHALADDLMIHVTGFFRDGDVWETLKMRVIEPMVTEKPEESSIRVWVTACSSGEEAYTIGILLLEAAEKVGKRFDIKIFATDTAERSLSQARAGIFPGGIEGEIRPDRLARYFDREDAHYKVKKELREIVIFAPQNVLQDPPFSRLDLCTCRNLLIYIEGEVQRRILSMLHFGLRENGVLLLGNSETITGAEDLFEPIDKPHRIYRRVGQTRRGSLDFPLPHVPTMRAAAEAGLGDGDGDDHGDGLRPRIARATVSQLAAKTLLDQYTPAAVVIDRNGQIIYFHGDTTPFLMQPSGEPTREVLAMAREEVRGAVRTALKQATAENTFVRVRDGHLGEGQSRLRIEVTAAPLGGTAGTNCFLVSFQTFPHPPVSSDPNADDAQCDSEELARVRDQLQSTIEELQTSNEEMKASHGEVTSINEELQSTNEELETSKEELQSLNEELTTVNAQLQAKMGEVEQSGNDLASLLSSTDIAVVFLDTQFRIRRFTPAARALIELIPSDAGRPLKDLAWKFDDAALMDDAQAVLDKLAPIAREMSGSDGRHYIRRVLPYRTSDNRVDGVVITFVDITDRWKAEQRVREIEERFRTMADAAPVLIWQTDDGGLTFLNRHYLEFVGESFDALAGMGWARFLHPDDAEAYMDVYRAAFARQEAYEHECRCRRGDGEYRWFKNICTPHRGSDGAFLGFIGCSVDVTDRKQAEEALREQNLRFQSIANLVPDLLWSSRPDGYTDWYNQRWSEYTGQTFEQAIGWGWAEAIHPDDREKSAWRYREAVEHGKTLVQEHRIRRHDGEYRWFLVRAEPVRDDAGVVTMFGSATDIHDQRATMAALRESEAVSRAVAEVVPEMLWQVDPTGVPLWHNHRWTEYTGQTVEQAKSGGWQNTVHPDDRDETRRTFEESLRTGQPWRREHRLANTGGEYRWFLVQGMPQRDEDGKITSWFGSVTDIHDQRTAAAEISESEGQLKSVMESALDFAIVLMDERQVITQWNAGATELLGWTDAEAIGQPGAMIYTDEDRADGVPEKEAGTALRDGRAPDERWHIRKDGSRFWGSGVLSVVRDEAGRHRGFVKILRDLTARQQTESDRARLLEAEQHARVAAEAANAAKDQFLANVSHELRTPLSAILLWSRVLREGRADAATLAEGLAAMEQSARAQQKLIEDLLDSARIATGKLTLELKPTDLAKTVGDAVTTIRPAAEAKGLEIHTAFSDDVGQVLADADRLQQVIWNLVNNAVKFTPAGGRVDIGLSRRDKTVEIRVSDTGVGVAAEELPNLFERFRQVDPSSTRRHGGLGLGLAISRQLVELHGGTIAAVSDGPGRGCAFTILLPLPHRAAKSMKAQTAKPAELADVRVLLVEDDERTRDVVVMLLRQAGAMVEAFGAADPAKAAFLADPPDLLLSDIGLPDKDGYTLLREVRAAEPTGQRVPALAFTAFDRPQDRRQAIDSGFDEFLSKPVDPVRLIQVLRTLLRR